MRYKQHCPRFYEYLSRHGYGLDAVQRKLKKSPTYVSKRATGKCPWTTDDMFILRKWLDIPVEETDQVFGPSQQIFAKK